MKHSSVRRLLAEILIALSFFSCLLFMVIEGAAEVCDGNYMMLMVRRIRTHPYDYLIWEYKQLRSEYIYMKIFRIVGI